jgi:triosephosphate isomerase
MRRPIIAGNWKMNKVTGEARDLIEDLVPRVRDIDTVEIVVCPPFTDLAVAAECLENSNIALGAQNMYFESSGAFTGEVSAEMLLDAGCTYVILGHSERRHILDESDELINRKVKAALAAGLKVMMCVGETLEERDAGLVEKIVKRHVSEGLKGLEAQALANLVIAYEPVWAIGTGRTATPEQAEEVHKLVRRIVAELHDQATADAMRVQYGGSVKPDNIELLMAEPDIDGALVGGAGLKADSFAGIVKGAATGRNGGQH